MQVPIQNTNRSNKYQATTLQWAFNQKAHTSVVVQHAVRWQAAELWIFIAFMTVTCVTRLQLPCIGSVPTAQSTSGKIYPQRARQTDRHTGQQRDRQIRVGPCVFVAAASMSRKILQPKQAIIYKLQIMLSILAWCLVQFYEATHDLMTSPASV